MRILLLFLAFFLTIPAAEASCSKSLVIGYADWHRGSDDYETEKKFSIDLELSERILSATGCAFKHQPMPMRRLLKAIEHGQIDGTMGASLTPERQQYAWFSVPYRNEEVVMFMRRKEAAQFWPASHNEIASSGKKVGMGIGAWFGPEMQSARKSNPIFDQSILRSDKLEIVFDWLLQGRVDIVVNELYTGLYQLQRKAALDKVAIHPFVINSDPVHLMLSQATIKTEDVIVINRAIKAFRATHEYAAILENYRKLAGR